MEAGPIQPTSFKIKKPEFEPRSDTNSANFYFKTEIDWLPFQLNIGKEVNLMSEQQSHSINLAYDNKEVFSLHDKDQMKHATTTMTDKPVYLPHCNIPRQLQGEV